MRNIFEQYEELENRLSHVLACCLREDPRLLRAFVQQFAGDPRCSVRPGVPSLG